MKLIEVNVEKFRNIINSTPVKIESDITCLVGKNESGKSAFLSSLYRLNPVRKNVKFIVEDQYPAWLEKKDRMKGFDLNKHRPIFTTFKLDEDEQNIIKDRFGENVLLDNNLILNRSYGDTFSHWLKVDEKQYLKNLITGLSFSKETRAEITICSKIEEIQLFLDSYKDSEKTTEKEKESIETLQERVNNQMGKSRTLIGALYSSIQKRVPKFIYFDEYSTLPYSVNIKELLETDESDLNDNLLTALSLLRMAAADDDYILNPDYERRKRELENVANALTQDVLKYWSQNNSLRVHPDITQKTENTPNGQTTVLDELKIRIWDDNLIIPGKLYHPSGAKCATVFPSGFDH
jgi:predicted ATP-dependent endonuclease of OLD family